MLLLLLWKYPYHRGGGGAVLRHHGIGAPTLPKGSQDMWGPDRHHSPERTRSERTGSGRVGPHLFAPTLLLPLKSDYRDKDQGVIAVVFDCKAFLFYTWSITNFLEMTILSTLRSEGEPSYAKNSLKSSTWDQYGHDETGVLFLLNPTSLLNPTDALSVWREKKISLWCYFRISYSKTRKDHLQLL